MQSSLHNFLDGLIGTPSNDGVKPSLLFRREMNRHGVLLSVFVVFRVRGKRAAGKSNKGSLFKKERTLAGLARSPKSYSRHRSFGRPLIGHFGCWARSSSKAIQRCNVRSSRAGFPSCRRNFFSYCNPTRYFRNSCSIVPIGRKSGLSILGRSMKPYFLWNVSAHRRMQLVCSSQGCAEERPSAVFHRLAAREILCSRRSDRGELPKPWDIWVASWQLRRVRHLAVLRTATGCSSRRWSLRLL
jgi:hypothetical protein